MSHQRFVFYFGGFGFFIQFADQGATSFFTLGALFMLYRWPAPAFQEGHSVY